MYPTVSVATPLGQELCHGESALSAVGDEHWDAHLRGCHGKLNGALLLLPTQASKSGISSPSEDSSAAGNNVV